MEPEILRIPAEVERSLNTGELLPNLHPALRGERGVEIQVHVHPIP